jgi:hypothetical protein
MNSTTSTSGRNRRRIAAWLAFAVLGVSMGAVWATGFASIGGATGTDTPNAALVDPSNPGDQVANLSGLATAGSAFTVNWAGRWGAVADTNFFTVDLSSKPNTETYNVAMLVTNDISSSNWTTLQLKVEAVDRATGACVPADFDGTNRPEIITIDAVDAGAYWNGLPGGDIYCIGVNASDGTDPLGTFIRRADETNDPSTYPTFVTTVDRAS